MKVSNAMGAKTLAPVLALLMVVATLAAVAPSASAVLTGEWTFELPMDGNRAQAVMVQDAEGTVYVMGGVSNASSYAAVPDAASLDLATGVWTTLAPMPIGVRGAAGAMGNDGLVYVFSGYNGTRVADTQIYNPVTDSWTTGTDVPIPAWEASAATTYDGRIWIAGGENAGLGDELQVYNPETDTWGTGTALPVQTLGGDMVAASSYLYLIGGSSGGYVATNASYKYYIWGGTWTELSPIPEPRTAHALAIGIDNQIYLAGGSDSASNTGGTVEDETYIYNRNTDEWSQGPDLNVPRKYLGAAATSDGNVYALGGNNASAAMDAVESLLLYEYEVGLSSSSVRAGDSVLMTADAFFTFAEEYYSTVYWHLVSSDDVVYVTDDAYNPLPSAMAVEITVPELAPPGDYTVVIEQWYIYTTSGSLYEYMIEIPLTVLPAEPLEDDIAALELLIEDLQEQLGEMNATVAVGDAALTAEIADLLAELSALQEQVSALEGELSDLLDSLNETQDSVDDAQASIDNKMDGALGLAVIGLLAVVILLLIVMMVMGRKPKVPEQPPEPPIE